jgi:hypothetical protein
VVESKHKRGPFDVRYPVRALATPPVWELPPAPDRAPPLAWSSFALQFYPGRSRHDFEALASYAAFGRAHEDAGLRPVPSPPPPGEWESEGGSVAQLDAARPGPRRTPARV